MHAQNDPEWLDRMYNNRALVPHHTAHFARWSADSQRARDRLGAVLDVAYGPAEGETLDVFPAVHPGAPVLVFIHGGYWRSLDKADHSFIAPAFAQAGACVVVLNYALCPAVSLAHIPQQMIRALAWVYRHIELYGGDPNRITVAGHSAGGHLATLLLTCDWAVQGVDLPAQPIRNALSISGLYDLEPLRHTPFLQEALQLTPELARQLSPALRPRPVLTPGRGVLYTVVGGDESPEFLRQNQLIHEAWGGAVVPVCEALPGLDHFSVLDALVEPRHRLNRLAWQLLVADEVLGPRA